MNRTGNANQSANQSNGGLQDSTLTANQKLDTEDRQAAAQMLDQVFPLQHGSHRDVASYLIYYDHLLAMFKDGSSCGLKTPKQLLNYSGHKSSPTSIILGCPLLSIEVELTPNSASFCGEPFVH